MKKLVLLFMFLMAISPLLSQRRSPEKYKDTVAGSIVYIRPNPDDLDNGAGFLVNNLGYIFTNYHVIKSSQTVKGIHIEFYDGEVYHPEKIVLIDSLYDIAILRIPNVPNRPVLPLFVKGEGIPGEDIVSFGHPLGFKFNMTKGVISNMNVPGAKQRLFFDAPTNPGNSGGPLLNKYGQVLGMVEGRYDSKNAGIDVQNLNTAIKVQYLKKALDSLRIPYNTDPLLEDLYLLDKQRMQSAQDSINKIQIAQAVEMVKARHRQDSIQAGLIAQKKSIDSAKIAQEALLKLIENERMERKKFQDSLRYANRPLVWTIKMGASFGYDFGAIKNIEETMENSKGGKYLSLDLMFGYRAGIESNNEKGTILGIFLSGGSIFKDAIRNTLQTEEPVFPSTSDYSYINEDGVYIENEYGLVVGETFRLSAGFGFLNVKNINLAYYSGTFGFIFPIGPVNIDILASTAVGRDYPYPTFKVKIGLAYRINFE